jgi:uncharacterized membrane protein
MFLLLLLVLATAYLLMRPGGYLANRQLTPQPAPEDDAKRVLADRYAKGDMTTDDFLERASVLNWTPGSEVYQSPKKRW